MESLLLSVHVVAGILGRDRTAPTRVGALVPLLSDPLTMINLRREALGA